MPILIMGLLALLVFVVLLFMLVGAVTAEHRQRDAEAKKQAQAAKAMAQGSGR